MLTIFKNAVMIGVLALTSNIATAQEFLSPEQAFQFFARMENPTTIEVRWAIEEGYSLYKNSLDFSTDSKNVKLGKPVIPKGVVRHDKSQDKMSEQFNGQLVIKIPVTGTGKFTLTAKGQGCADAGLCYMPFERTEQLNTVIPKLEIKK